MVTGLRQLLLEFGQAATGQLVLFLLQGSFLDLHLDDLPGNGIQLRGHGIHLGADLSAGLVHQVDGLVRQEAVGDIAVGEGGRGDDGGIGNLHAVEHFIPFLQATEDGDGIFHGRLLHQHRLEAAFQSGILLDILAVLVQGGGTDTVQLATGQHGFQQVARVHAAFGLASTHDGMQFIDEQDDAAVGLLDFRQDSLQTLLKFAAILGTGDEGTHVQRENGLILKALGHVALDDALGQTLGDGGLTDTGFADQDGIVLGLSGQDPHHIADLFVTADDGVLLALTSTLHQIGAVLFQGIIGALRVITGDTLVAAN